ncbi:hypothetical protein BP6252_07764 [Coleophoma cylindrospora]|uniref:Uncharacterized protein n=1 Tax=Coleophoma cylindrospora TaxID=1849047 RepID=A0A3D8RBE6_9HELO|nr:hypothetical protein BP6252_07764 [Coleophoma cylindrospora]
MASTDKQTIAQLQASLAAANARATAAEGVVKSIRDELKNRNNAKIQNSEALPEGTSKDTGIYDDTVGNASSDAAERVSVSHWKAYNAAFYEFEKELAASKTDPQSASNTDELLKGLRALGTPRGSLHTTLAEALCNETTIGQSRATGNNNNATHFRTIVENINQIVEGYKPLPAGGADGATPHSGSGHSCSSGDLQSIQQTISDIRNDLLGREKKWETMVGQHNQLTDELEAASQVCQYLMDSLEDLVAKLIQERQLSTKDDSSHKAGDGSKRKRTGSNSEQSRAADLEQQVNDLQAVVDQLKQQISNAIGDQDNNNQDGDNQDGDNQDGDNQDEGNQDEDNQDEDELKKRIKELEAELKKTKADRDRLQKALDDMQKKLRDCRSESWQDRKKRVQAEARAQKGKGAKSKKAGAIGRNELKGLGISF